MEVMQALNSGPDVGGQANGVRKKNSASKIKIKRLTVDRLLFAVRKETQIGSERVSFLLRHREKDDLRSVRLGAPQ